MNYYLYGILSCILKMEVQLEKMEYIMEMEMNSGSSMDTYNTHRLRILLYFLLAFRILLILKC